MMFPLSDSFWKLVMQLSSFLSRFDCMSDWSFSSGRRRLELLNDAMIRISPDELVWQEVFESLEFAERSAHHRSDTATEKMLARLQRLLHLARDVISATPETFSVNCGPAPWEKGQLQGFSRRVNQYYDPSMESAVFVLQTLRDNITLLPESSWFEMSANEIKNALEEMRFYRGNSE